MKIIQHEIFDQNESLLKTRKVMLDAKQTLLEYLQKPHKCVIFIACGSGYMLSTGAASLFSTRTDKKAVALAGGEVLLNPKKYAPLFDDALVVTISRSGETSEVVKSLRAMSELASFSSIAILAKDACTIKDQVDFSIDIPWAFDESVCQTRNISNFYYALTMLYAFYVGDTALEESFDRFFAAQPQYIADRLAECEQIAPLGWDNVTVLADGEICGIAQEGGLAFTEISILPGNHFCFLDYRHGPVVVADSKKLVIAVLNSEDEVQQKKFMAEIRARGAYVISMGGRDKAFWGTDHHVNLDQIDRFEVYGLALINLCQILAFCKALCNGHDPDAPDGLDAFIVI